MLLSSDIEAHYALRLHAIALQAMRLPQSLTLQAYANASNLPIKITRRGHRPVGVILNAAFPLTGDSRPALR